MLDLEQPRTGSHSRSL